VFDDLRTWLWQQGESPQIQNLVASIDGVEFFWSVPKALAINVAHKLTAIGALVDGPHIEECAIISVIGSGFWQSPETLVEVRKVAAQPRFLDVKNNAITIAVKNDQVAPVVDGLHQALIARS
jgi:aspartokinase